MKEVQNPHLQHPRGLNKYLHNYTNKYVIKTAMIDRKGNYRMLWNPLMKGFDSEFSHVLKKKENMHSGFFRGGENILSVNLSQ